MEITRIGYTGFRVLYMVASQDRGPNVDSQNTLTLAAETPKKGIPYLGKPRAPSEGQSHKK